MAEIDLQEMGRRARAAGHRLGLLPAGTRNAALGEIARRLEALDDELWAANAADLEEARAAGLSPALLDRSTITPKRLAAMAAACRDVAALPDPLGQIFEGKTLPSGLPWPIARAHRVMRDFRVAAQRHHRDHALGIKTATR